MKNLSWAVAILLLAMITVSFLELIVPQKFEAKILPALWTLTAGLAIGPVIFAFHFGGSLDRQQKQQEALQ